MSEHPSLHLPTWTEVLGLAFVAWLISLAHGPAGDALRGARGPAILAWGAVYVWSGISLVLVAMAFAALAARLLLGSAESPDPEAAAESSADGEDDDEVVRGWEDEPDDHESRTYGAMPDPDAASDFAARDDDVPV